MIRHLISILRAIAYLVAISSIIYLMLQMGIDTEDSPFMGVIKVMGFICMFITVILLGILAIGD